ncbi:MAG: undecaprenyl-diphosphate phosphatase [Bacillota bacterium]|nr:undecaprenyl-diphosphate phosphatase [Bacillota bacterium]
MDILQGLILGIVQGLTEFLPVSSSGHLELFQHIFGIKEGAATFDVAVHLATLIAVIAVFWKDIIEIIKRPFSKITLLILVGTAPTLAIALALKKTVENLLSTGSTLGIEFIITGLALWFAESIKTKNKEEKETTYVDALIIGIAQGIAIMPAISRSGLTISSALFRGLKREFAAKYSFLLSIPIILAAAADTTLDIVKHKTSTSIEFFPMIVGMVAAAISGYIAVKFMIKMISKGNLRVFSYYVFVLGGLIILDQLFFHIFFTLKF